MGFGRPIVSRRGRLALRRWVEMLVFGVVGAIAILAFIHWRRKDLQILIDVPLWIPIAGGTGLLAILARWGIFTGARHLPSYPPLWVGSLFGAGILLLAVGGSTSVRRDLMVPPESVGSIWLLGMLCVVAVGVLALGAAVSCLLRRPGPRVALDEGSSPTPQELDSFDKLTEWLARDDSPSSMADDRFGHARIARRIAERLMEHRPPAQAIVGGLGAGKTTLRNFVKDALTKLGGNRRVRVVSVELWPYETSRAAVEGVIRGLVDALAKEVNVIGLRGLASSYADAMSASGGWLAALVRLQGVPTRPLDSLKAIDDVATVIGIRYVVWIEDLERFAAGETSQANEEKLNPIRALLYGLDQLNSITVVTATTTLRMRFDIEKIARYVEALPELGGPQVGKILDLFRTGCLRAPDLIDPATPESREQLNVLQHSEIYAIRRLMWGREIHDAADALLTLCVTPRAIKQALRACLDTWKRLRGEIDFDDALVLCVIRETQPAAFAIIQDHIQYLRRGRRAREEEQRTAQAAWESALGALPMDDRQRAAVRYLVEFVFGERNAWQKPQGPTEHYHTDYWERFSSLPKLEYVERDQPVLHTLLQPDDAAVLDLLQGGATRSAAVEDFERLLSTDRLVRVFLPLVGRRSEERPDSWERKEPPGLIPLWRMWKRRWEQGQLAADTVLEQVKRAFDIAIPRNLGLTTDIEEYFVVSSPNVPQLLGPAERIEAKAYCRTLFERTYRGRGEALSRSLRDAKRAIVESCG